MIDNKPITMRSVLYLSGVTIASQLALVLVLHRQGSNLQPYDPKLQCGIAVMILSGLGSIALSASSKVSDLQKCPRSVQATKIWFELKWCNCFVINWLPRMDSNHDEVIQSHLCAGLACIVHKFGHLSIRLSWMENKLVINSGYGSGTLQLRRIIPLLFEEKNLLPVLQL